MQSGHDLNEEVGSALELLSLDVRNDNEGLEVDGQQVRLHLEERAHPTVGDVARFGPATVPTMIISDRLSRPVRELLNDLGYSWFDRRGQIRIWHPGLRIDAPVPLPSTREPKTTARRVAKVFTDTTMDVAVALLANSTERASPRALGSTLGRSPGYVSTVLRTFTAESLVSHEGRPLIPDLFWELAGRWSSEWTYVTETRDVVLTQLQARLTGPHAAAILGAAVLLSDKEPVQLLVHNQQDIRRLINRGVLHIASHPSVARVALRAQPNTAQYDFSVAGEAIAHPIICALDMAIDTRGRETVANWVPHHHDLTELAMFEVARRTQWPLRDLGEFLDQPHSNQVWKAAINAFWTDADLAGLAASDYCPTEYCELVSRQLLVIFEQNNSGGVQQHLAAVETALTTPTPPRWSGEWSGPDMPWMEQANRARNLTDDAGRETLLRELLDSSQPGRAMPLTELLPSLNWAQRTEAIASICASVPGISDRHLAAKVLATAASHVAGTPDAERLIEKAVRIAKSAVHESFASSFQPGGGGVHGLVAIAETLPASQRSDLLQETVRLWKDWVAPQSQSPGSGSGRRFDPHMFHSGGDVTSTLVSLLSHDELVDPLQTIFDTIRAVAGKEGNALEGYLSTAASAGLLRGSIELSALLVREARRPTPSSLRHVSTVDTWFPPRPFPDVDFPETLVGFRRVW